MAILNTIFNNDTHALPYEQTLSNTDMLLYIW